MPGRKSASHSRTLLRSPTRLFSMSLTQKPESGMKLNDVVTFSSIAEPWKKSPDHSRLALFHAKFWGKSSDDEELEWNNLQSNVDGDDDVIMDSGGDEEKDGTDVDGDDDIPGCFKLNINPVSDDTKIWIRADYIRFYDYTERYDKRPIKAQAVILQGQPGIGECVCVYLQDTLLIVNEGKSVCLVYMLRRRCAERKPVIWYDGEKGYIFVGETCFECESVTC
jgi:hypothetical protein